MSYLARYQLTENCTFRNKLQMAVWIAALDVINESSATPNHAARLIWATKMLRGVMDTDVARKVAIRASANATIGAAGEAALDSDIQFVINGLVDELA